VTRKLSVSLCRFSCRDGNNNAYGENIKVVIISRAGAEGLDFKIYGKFI
jgi:hypothetical protein